MWFNLIIGAFFIILGLMVHVGKFYFLISGYNTMRKEKKANVDIRGLARLIGVYSYANGSIFILMGVLQAAGFNPDIMPAVIFLLLTSIVLVFMSQRYDYNLFDADGKLRRGAGKKLFVTVAIVVGSLVLVGILLFFSSRDTKISFLEEGLEIYGIYGDVYAWEDMNHVQLLQDLPKIEARTNGAAIGSKLKGNFRTSEYGAVKLFLDVDVPPFIYFEIGNAIIIFNLADDRSTKEIFEKINMQIAE